MDLLTVNECEKDRDKHAEKQVPPDQCGRTIMSRSDDHCYERQWLQIQDFKGDLDLQSDKKMRAAGESWFRSRRFDLVP